MFDRRGFSLVELLAAMAILSVIFSIAIYKFDVFGNMAREGSLRVTLEELNSREKLVWHNVRLSNEGYVDDSSLFMTNDYDLDRVKWAEGPNENGGVISTDGGNVYIHRKPSTSGTPAEWSR